MGRKEPVIDLSRSSGAGRAPSILLACTLALGITSAHATDYTWGGGDGNWSDVNWSPGPATGPTAGADTATIASGTVSLDVGGMNVGAITLGAGGTFHAYNWNGVNTYTAINSLLLQGGVLHGTGSYHNWGAGILRTVSASGAGTSTISASSFFNLDGTGANRSVFDVADVTGNASADLTVSAVLADVSADESWTPAALVKTGAGTLRLTAANGFTGGTTVDAGKLQLEAYGGVGRIRGALSINTNGVVETTGDGTGLGWDEAITAVTINEGALASAGTIHIWNIAGGVTLNGGALRSNDGVSNPNGPQLEWNRVDVHVGAAATNTAEIGGRIRIREDGGYAGITFNVGNGSAATDLLVSAAITEASAGRGITKSGSGTMVLSGTNSYTGATTVNGGTLSLTTRSIGNSAAVVLAAGATLNLNFSGSDVVGSLEINGSGPLPAGTYDSSHPTYGSYFTGSGSLLIPGPVGDADGTWIGLADGDWIEAGNWRTNTIASGTGRTATFNASAGATVSLSANRTIGHLVFDTSDYVLAGGSTLTLDAPGAPDISVGTGRTALISAPVAGSVGLRKSGPGTLVFSGVKSYAGGTAVDGGTLELAGAAGGTGLIPGTLTVSTGATVALTSGDGTGFGWNNAVTNLTINGGAVNAAGGSHIGFGPSASIALNNGGAISGNWQWNGDSLLGFSAAGDSENRLSGNVTLRADAGAYHTFNVADGAAAVDLLVDATLGDQWPETWWVSSSALVKTGNGTMKLAAANTYGGVTLIDGGVLEVGALADYGVASSLGNRTAGDDAGGDVGILFRGGTLRYAGATAQSTDRGIRLGTTGGGGTIDASGSSPSATLSFTASASPNFLESSGDRVLTLTGNNTGSNLFGMAIVEAGGTTSLNKAGPGLWILGGVNTYNGPTLISNGTLLVNGTLATGPVSVAAGATLGGTGAVGGVVTMDGTLAPGAGIGRLTLSGQVIDGGTAVYRFELGGTNGPTDYDQLVVGDIHSLAGLLEVVVTNGYVPAGGDRFNILTNSGLGGLLIGTFSGLSAPALPAGLGWAVQYTATESVTLVVTGTLTGGQSAYETWAQSIPNPAERGEQADPDGDGYANLLEYSQGTDATNGADHAKLSLLRTNGQFQVLFNRVNSATDIVYAVEGAYLPTNGATWLGIATNQVGSWGASANVEDNNTAAVHRVLVTDTEIGTNRSLRLHVTRP